MNSRSERNGVSCRLLGFSSRKERLLTENTGLQKKKNNEKKERMSGRSLNEYRGWEDFRYFEGGSYLLAAPTPLPTKGLSYFL